MAGADTISSVVGPLSASFAGIALFMKVVIDAKPGLSKPALIPMPWNSNSQTFTKYPLKIRVLIYHGADTPHPPITNTLNAVVAKLKKLLKCLCWHYKEEISRKNADSMLEKDKSQLHSSPQETIAQESGPHICIFTPQILRSGDRI